MPPDDHGLSLVPRAAARLRVYPAEVRLVIRMVQPLSAAHRQLVAKAIDLIDEHADMQEQLDEARD